MSQDIEKLLESVTPRGAPPELRARVLARVAETLGTPSATAFRAESQPPTSAGTACGPCFNPRVLASSASAPPHTQAEVPQAVAHTRGPRHHLDTLLAWAVAGLVLLGIGLNFAAVRIGDSRLAAYEPPRPEPVSNEQLVIALAQASPRAGDVLESRLVALRWSRREAAGEDALRQYQEIVKQTLSLLKEPFHAACQENPEMDVHRRRRIGGHTTDCQRLFRLDHRLTA